MPACLLFPSQTNRFRVGETCPAGLGRGKHAPQGLGRGNMPSRVREARHSLEGLVGSG